MHKYSLSTLLRAVSAAGLAGRLATAYALLLGFFLPPARRPPQATMPIPAAA